jgi:hypothetical protein
MKNLIRHLKIGALVKKRFHAIVGGRNAEHSCTSNKAVPNTAYLIGLFGVPQIEDVN